MSLNSDKEFRIVETSNPNYCGPKWGYKILTIISIYAIIYITSQLTLSVGHSQTNIIIFTGIFLTLLILLILIRITRNMFKEEYLQYRFYFFVTLYFGLYGSVRYNSLLNQPNNSFSPEILWEYKLMAGSSGIASLYILGNLIYSYIALRVNKKRILKIDRNYSEIKAEAVRAFENDSWQEAISHYENAINYLASFNNPIFTTNILTCRYNMAIAHFNNSNFRDSLSILQQLREAFPQYMPDVIEEQINDIKGLV